MARLRALPAILLLLSPGLAVYWAGEFPEPPLKALTIQLNPALFESFSWNMHEWTLTSGRIGLLLEVETQRRNKPADLPPNGWFTLSRDFQPRYLLHRGDGYLRIYSRNAEGRFEETSIVPVDLKAGATWFDGRFQGSCSADSIDTMAGTFRTLRVDLSKDGDILQSLWFAPDEGLVAWKGIDLALVSRKPESFILDQVRDSVERVGTPASRDLHLKPARFEHVGCKLCRWTLSPGVPEGIPLPRSTVRSDPDRWFTLSLEDTPRYLIHEDNEFISLYLSVQGYPEAAQIPLPLRAGMTWTSQGSDFPRSTKQTEEWGSCTTERLTLKSGTYDALRVDFSRSGQVQQSLCFAPGEGLLQWAGIENTPISRVNDTAPEKLLLAAAQGYSAYGRVVDWTQDARADCEVYPSPPWTSASGDRRTHGNKLYYLFAKDRGAYQRAKDQHQPEGQIVVKESWYPGNMRAKGPLFMMMKFEGDWFYATATADGTRLTGSGKITSCMKCHDHAPHDKLFGLAESPASIILPEER